MNQMQKVRFFITYESEIGVAFRIVVSYIIELKGIIYRKKEFVF